MDEAAKGADRSLAVTDVRRMRIARLVRERVVLSVVGHPLRDRALHRHATQNSEHGLHRCACLEAAMREVAVEADRRPEGAHDVEEEKEGGVYRMERDVPEKTHRRE